MQRSGNLLRQKNPEKRFSNVEAQQSQQPSIPLRAVQPAVRVNEAADHLISEDNGNRFFRDPTPTGQAKSRWVPPFAGIRFSRVKRTAFTWVQIESFFQFSI